MKDSEWSVFKYITKIVFHGKERISQHLASRNIGMFWFVF